MSENSPGTRVAPSVGSDLNIRALNNPLTLEVLRTFYDLCISSCGPKGLLKVVHNEVGGHVTLTSSCDRLLNSMTFSNPIIKLIVSAVNGHLKKFHDGGLFIVILATALIRNSLACTVPRLLMTEIYETLLRHTVNILNNEDFSCKKNIDFENSMDHKNLIRSILSTKVGCCLFGDDLEYLTSLIFRSFLSVSPRDGKNAYGTLIYMTAEGLSVTDSSLYGGILIDTPHILPYKAKSFKMPRPSGSETRFIIAVFSMSLSGDAEECIDANYEIDDSLNVMSDMLSNVKQLMDHLIDRGVHLICCQRVIHPQIKVYLKQKDVMTLDRLGKINIQHLMQVTGGSLIGSLHQGYDASFGALDGVSAVVINQRTYLQMRSTEAQVSTIILGHRTEEALQELKATCKKCEEVLKLTLNDGRVLSGGGCWQSVLTAHIESKVEENREVLENQLDCTSQQLQSTLMNITSALKSTITALDKNSCHMTDAANRHHWNISNCNKDCDWSVYPDACECGTMLKMPETNLTFLNEENKSRILGSRNASNEQKILDSFPVMLNAFQTAVSIANLVLGIENIIVDKN